MLLKKLKKKKKVTVVWAFRSEKTDTSKFGSFIQIQWFGLLLCFCVDYGETFFIFHYLRLWFEVQSRPKQARIAKARPNRALYIIGVSLKTTPVCYANDQKL